MYAWGRLRILRITYIYIYISLHQLWIIDSFVARLCLKFVYIYIFFLRTGILLYTYTYMLSNKSLVFLKKDIRHVYVLIKSRNGIWLAMGESISHIFQINSQIKPLMSWLLRILLVSRRRSSDMPSIRQSISLQKVTPWSNTCRFLFVYLHS